MKGVVCFVWPKTILSRVADQVGAASGLCSADRCRRDHINRFRQSPLAAFAHCSQDCKLFVHHFSPAEFYNFLDPEMSLYGSQRVLYVSRSIGSRPDLSGRTGQYAQSEVHGGSGYGQEYMDDNTYSSSKDSLRGGGGGQGTMTQCTSRLCKGRFTKKESDGVLHQITWPPQSPDHPIEMVWEELDCRVKEKQPTSAQHMWELLQDCWKCIPGEAG
ncbi:uncharacterized protein LOC118358682 isoform X2 [Oncorhynchus keta]|uniref:uncharacterized protein LOC118358682 isoform X2 n=1 Tax=Oncorhynchus keta TaxID=8018 RepID=UPI00227B4810|nr:uncharacterized protein LOC118358682 isoform X2 [Oncorhynchus keta]